VRGERDVIIMCTLGQQQNESSSSSSSSSSPQTMKCYSQQDMEVFNLLRQPLWVFDVTKKQMWWANGAAMELWNADSLDSLLSRDFSDMSESTQQRLNDYMIKFQQGESVTEQWTYYPKGRGPTTVAVTMSGIMVENGRMVMLNEGKEIPKEELDLSALRGVEMLRHLPVSVCQFDSQGVLMQQNPEFSSTFGDNPSRRETHRTDKIHFQDLFVDEALGSQIFEEVVESGQDYCVDALQRTRSGLKWFAIKVRKSRDPVTENPIVLYSARDITDTVKAKKEADDANMQKSEFLAVMAHEIR
jgi:PAS domain-containing protein